MGLCMNVICLIETFAEIAAANCPFPVCWCVLCCNTFRYENREQIVPELVVEIVIGSRCLLSMKIMLSILKTYLIITEMIFQLKAMITVSLLKKHGLLKGNALAGFEDMDKSLVGVVLMDVLKKVNTVEFRKSPRLTLAAYKADRGPTREARIPDDLSLTFIEDHLKKIESII